LKGWPAHMIATKLPGRTVESIKTRLRRLRETVRNPKPHTSCGRIERQSRAWTAPTTDQEADRERRALHEPDLTARFCGDPKPGQSALEKMRAQGKTI